MEQWNTIPAMQNLLTRRSVRSYQPEQIEDWQLEAVLAAGQYAPTGRNRMSTKFVAIQNSELRGRLSKMNAAILGTDNDPFYGAPTVVLVLADSSAPTYWEDGSLAMGNLLNAAHAVGLGSCWIHRAREIFESIEGKALLKEWNIPKSYVGIGFCILGKTDGDVPEPVARRTDQVVCVR